MPWTVHNKNKEEVYQTDMVKNETLSSIGNTTKRNDKLFRGNINI